MNCFDRIVLDKIVVNLTSSDGGNSYPAMDWDSFFKLEFDEGVSKKEIGERAVESARLEFEKKIKEMQEDNDKRFPSDHQRGETLVLSKLLCFLQESEENRLRERKKT